jgi:hypothetical protein
MTNFKKHLNTVLKKRYDNNCLASLYILRYDSNTTNPEDWIQEFLSQFTIVKNDHPDVLNIKRAEEEKNYKVDGEQWAHFQSFIQYRPYILKNKFVFIHDAHRITDILSNKLLKIFEDSPQKLTTFLFLKDQQTLLPTILSRAISLQIFASNQGTAPHEFSTYQNPNKISSEIKILEDGEAVFIESVIHKVLAKSPDYKKTSELLEEIRSFEKYSEFNNSQLSRIALILP